VVPAAEAGLREYVLFSEAMIDSLSATEEVEHISAIQLGAKTKEIITSLTRELV
jgi:hypothetical protein